MAPPMINEVVFGKCIKIILKNPDFDIGNLAGPQLVELHGDVHDAAHDGHLRDDRAKHRRPRARPTRRQVLLTRHGGAR